MASTDTQFPPVPSTSTAWTSNSPKKGVITGPLSTPLTGVFTNPAHKENPKPSWEWTQEEIEKEELRVRAAFMRASVNYKMKLRELSSQELSVVTQREKGKLRNRELFIRFNRVSKFGLTLAEKQLWSREKKESEFMNEMVEECTQQACRMKESLEKRLEDYNKLTNPTAEQTEQINMVKLWLSQFPKTMANLEKSQEVRRKELQKLEKKRKREETQPSPESSDKRMKELNGHSLLGGASLLS